MPRQSEPGFSERFQWFVDTHGMPWLIKQGSKRLSLRAFAMAIGERSSTVSSWVNLGKTPDRKKLQRIAELVGAPEPEAMAAFLVTGVGKVAEDVKASRQDGNPIIRMIEAELEGEVTDANARLVVETLKQILATARKAGLIALHVVFLVVAMDKAEAREAGEAREAQGGNVGKLSIPEAKPENILFSWFAIGRGAGSHILVVFFGLQERKPVRLKVAV